MWGEGKPKIGILMGSPGDREQLEDAINILQDFGVDHEVHVMSAHRNPEKVREYASAAEGRGIQALICAAGLAAHLAGAVAANSMLPVIGIPIQGGALNGLDALLSTVQMPRGIPVASMAIGKHGAINAVLFALQIVALNDPAVRERFREYRQAMAAR